MKKYIVILIGLLSMQLGFGQEFSKESVIAFQDNMNTNFRNPETSPLKEEDLETFDGLDFYEISEKYFVRAKFIRIPDEKPFEMPTTTDRKPMYIKYGEIHFELDGKTCRLDVFQNIELSKKPLYKNSLFLPFTDLTSGEESYGGGRYIDLEIPQGDVIYIDFNKAYNPYCVYNYKYSCPIPPEQNDLPVEIKAGVKKYKD
jgi:uncharacterized protein (DUF1684 family)